MRKVSILFTLLALVVLAVVPLQAQDQTIADIVVASAGADEAEFSILLAAVQAADPGILEALSNPDADLTVFAPTDAAFAALLEGLGMSAEDVLANTELLNATLQYHVLDGAVFAETVVTLDGASVPTLQGEELTITVNDDGVFLNDSVQVVQTDIEASNGVIHVIDTVLVPEAVTMMLGDDMMDDDMMMSSAHIRAAHFSPDAGLVDVYVNGEVALADVDFPVISDWMEVEAGTYSVAVAPAGTSLDDAVIGPADITLEAGDWITVAAIGGVGNGTLGPAIINEDFSDLGEGDARVNVFHAIEGAPAVDVFAGGDVIIPQLAYPGDLGDNDGLFSIDVPAGTYDLSVVASGTTTEILDLSGTELSANTIYFVAAVGTPDAPQVALAATHLDDMMMGDDMMDDMMMSDTIADIVVASAGADDAEFTILLAAVSAADPSVLEALSNPDADLTVFAPTDAAFAALLGDLGMEAGDLLAATEVLNTTLLYHVIEGATFAETVVTLDGASVPTLQGEEITITVNDEGVFLNETFQVIQTDIEASNGVIHVIDAVLIPQATLDLLGG